MARKRLRKSGKNTLIWWIASICILLIMMSLFVFNKHVVAKLNGLNAECVSKETCRLSMVEDFHYSTALLFTVIVVVFIVFMMFYVSFSDAHTKRNATKAYERILNGIANGVAKLSMKDGTLHIDYANEGFYNMQGYTKHEYKEKYKSDPFALLDTRDKNTVLDAFSSLEPGHVVGIEYHIMTISNSERWILVNVEMSTKKDRNVYLCTFTDVTKHKRSEDELALANERISFILGKIDSIIVEYDLNRDEFTFITKADRNYPFHNLIDLYKYGALTKTNYDSIVLMMENCMNRRVNQNVNMQMKYNGKTAWYEVRMNTLFDSTDNPSRVLITITDIDSAYREKAKLIDMAEREPMTGLLNKKSAEERINESMLYDLHNSALFFVDIDDFKHVNDTLGHQKGDEVIVYVASELASLFRTDDIVARIGGDEFVVYMRDLKDMALVSKRAQAICDAFDHYQFENSSMGISCSIGIALYPGEGSNCTELLEHADEAMYECKKHGKNRFMFYHDIEKSTQSAVEEGE